MTPRHQTKDFEQLEVSQIYCPKCKSAMPVRKQLLLVLLDKETYDCAGSARTGERTLRVSVDAALRAGIFKVSGSFDPMGWSVGARRSFPRP